RSAGRRVVFSAQKRRSVPMTLATTPSGTARCIVRTSSPTKVPRLTRSKSLMCPSFRKYVFGSVSWKYSLRKTVCAPTAAPAKPPEDERIAKQRSRESGERRPLRIRNAPRDLRRDEPGREHDRNAREHDEERDLRLTDAEEMRDAHPQHPQEIGEAFDRRLA